MKILWLCIMMISGVGGLIWIRLHGSFRRGNEAQYDLKYVQPDPDSPLKGKIIFCLGSSVTSGLASCGISFADYLQKKDGCQVIKAAVSASTLADIGFHSYIRRLKRHPALRRHIDCFLCQLSTNDATFRSSLGKISDSYRIEDFDTRTTLGGIEYIIGFAKKTWDCPVVFFTGTRYDNPRYHQMINQLLELQEKWDIEVIDLWHDRRMNQISPEDYHLYMNDGVHPTKAGYLKWWTPAIENRLCEILREE